MRRRTRYSKNGYTLIEVLIAVAIFSAMVVVSSMALNQGLSQYQNLKERGINFWDKAKYLWLNKSLSSTVDYYVFSRGDGWFPYFRGNQELVSYVSLSPFAGQAPVVVWIRNERQDDGSRSLVYYELPVYAKTLKDIERDFAFKDYEKGSSIALVKKAEDISITFYGYGLPDYRWSWTSEFDGARKKTLPQTLKIAYKDKATGEKNSIILPVNTNSMIKTIYNESYTE